MTLEGINIQKRGKRVQLDKEELEFQKFIHIITKRIEILPEAIFCILFDCKAAIDEYGKHICF